jgi:hypothetical protein
MAAGGTRLLDRLIIWSSMSRGHSIEDGTEGLLRASCAPEVGTREFFGPAIPRHGGPAELLDPERDPPAEALLWRESLASVGLSDFFG